MLYSLFSESTGTPLHLIFLTDDQSKVIRKLSVLRLPLGIIGVNLNFILEPLPWFCMTQIMNFLLQPVLIPIKKKKATPHLQKLKSAQNDPND